MRPEVSKEINAFVEAERIPTQNFMCNQVKNALTELHYETSISEARISQAAHQFTNDIAKIGIYQDDGISVTKYIGYLAFWVRKTSPFGIVYRSAEIGSDRKEIATANADVSLYVIKNTLIDLSKAVNPDLWPEYTKRTLREDPESFRINLVRAFSDYMFEKRHIRYIAHSLSIRTFGPHHMTMLADFLLYLACTPKAVDVFRADGSVGKAIIRSKT